MHFVHLLVILASWIFGETRSVSNSKRLLIQAVKMCTRRAFCARAWRGLVGAASLLLAVACVESDADTVALGQLPREGRATHALIHQGGPFPYEKDGTVFGNRERLLPLHPRGYWREYTVKTPDTRGRGARRIVCGGKPRTPDACYYSSDHYASFRKIRP